MPLPLAVAVVGARPSQVAFAKRWFRLAPGMSAPILCSLESMPESTYVHPRSLPGGTVGFWLALDAESLAVCLEQHERNLKRPGYSRGSYDLNLPEACVLAAGGERSGELRNSLAEWSKRVADAFYASS
jgi:hypothetical protein